MTDPEWVSFLQWALPRMEMKWSGFRKVRGQVRKRVKRRMGALGLSRLEEYRRRLEVDSEEWGVLDRMCRITISRFWRDRKVWEDLADTVLPALDAAARERGDERLRVWSAGCASGEEPYSVALVGAFLLTDPLPIAITATDVDPCMLERARDGRYQVGSLRALPEGWRVRAFEALGGKWALREAFRVGVRFLEQDVRYQVPAGPFDLVLCRNLAFTYFTPVLQRAVAARIAGALVAGGALVVGCHEAVPPEAPLVPWEGVRSVYYRRTHDTL
ncbi:MAG: chemotaxis protein CheR [Deltaproteobacteria bacterium]|nr:chemotaxis protein CheR [Deltaproteobacteria bacterium]MBW2254884.1 chemotaxis protein CheR [Deltaproteobacteria bacterium]